MAEILGFDSRYTTTIPEDTEYQFAGIKISEAVGGGPYTQPKIQWQLATDMRLHKMPFHFWRGSRTEHEQNGIDQAEWFRDVYEEHFGSISEADLPPVIDCEDVYANAGLSSLRDIVACLKRTEDLWGIPRYSALLYSAGWWWDTWIKPYTDPHSEIYKWKLWEADPPPETPIGYWAVENSKIVQRILDFVKDGFNASIDENIVTDNDWYNKQVDDAIVIPPKRVRIEIPEDADIIELVRV